MSSGNNFAGIWVIIKILSEFYHWCLVYLKAFSATDHRNTLSFGGTFSIIKTGQGAKACFLMQANNEQSMAPGHELTTGWKASS